MKRFFIEETFFDYFCELSGQAALHCYYGSCKAHIDRHMTKSCG